MGMQDRDYYREWWAKKTGYVERASFRISETERVRKNQSWHPVLTVLLTSAICLAVYVVLRTISKYT